MLLSAILSYATLTLSYSIHSLLKYCPCQQNGRMIPLLGAQKSISCETSCSLLEALATFQATHKMLSLPRLLTLFCAALPLRFKKKAFFACHENRLSISTNCCAWPEIPTRKSRHAAKVCTCHATRARFVYACHNLNATKPICDETDLQQMILSHFVSAAQRCIDLKNKRTPANGCCVRLRTVANTKTTLTEHDSNLQTSRVKRKPFATHSGIT